MITVNFKCDDCKRKTKLIVTTEHLRLRYSHDSINVPLPATWIDRAGYGVDLPRRCFKCGVAHERKMRPIRAKAEREDIKKRVKRMHKAGFAKTIRAYLEPMFPNRLDRVALRKFADEFEFQLEEQKRGLAR